MRLQAAYGSSGSGSEYRKRSAFSGLVATLILLGLAGTGCSSLKHVEPASSSTSNGPLAYGETMTNSPEIQAKPYVVLVSIDGYRHDYNQIFSPPNLSKLQKEGVSAESLRSIYPSKTFPNHYAMATGLYADRHGIVSNEFYDPKREATYALPDRKAVEDGTWYSGIPLWLALGKQGMITASYFWVGSEANIQGAHPNYYYRYDESVPSDTRVSQVLAWLALPPERRPHFITLYFSDVDTAAHAHGVRSAQTKEAVAKIDDAIGKLREGLAATGLPVNLVVVSDHGMMDIDPKKTILLDEDTEAAKILPKFKAVGRGPQMLLYLNKGEDPKVIDEALRVLKRSAKHFRVHKRAEMKRFNYDSNERAGDLVIEPDAPYIVGLKESPPKPRGANHGWDPTRFREMHGIFYAAGPGLKERTKLPTFENVDVFPFVLDLLKMTQIPDVDGQLKSTRKAVR